MQKKIMPEYYYYYNYFTFTTHVRCQNVIFVRFRLCKWTVNAYWTSRTRYIESGLGEQSGWLVLSSRDLLRNLPLSLHWPSSHPGPVPFTPSLRGPPLLESVWLSPLRLLPPDSLCRLAGCWTGSGADSERTHARPSTHRRVQDSLHVDAQWYAIKRHIGC